MRDAATAPGRSERLGHARGARAPAVAAAVGALVGITWAAALRAYMAALAGHASDVTWTTLAAILVPGAVAGASIGLAHALGARGLRRAWLLGLGPLAFALPMLEPSALVELLTSGMGGGAVAVPVALVLGGFGAGSLGPRAVRVACLAVALLLSVGFAAAVPAVGGPGLAIATPRGAWIVVLAIGLMLSGILGTALAFRGAVAVER